MKLTTQELKQWKTAKQLYREQGIEMQSLIEIAKRLNIIRSKS